ncbi:P-type ATPase (P-ATPase) Superfamily [Achlya hypogyna]|uniref:Cation-transporting ATPase n=1 Tax=Achlya hypogyna TaxID=1202772 RepID=A0A1V9YMB8_ACHHY|nr:P-type ATPase (P-ATPase) Superfamily [Achlya hypogyna]
MAPCSHPSLQAPLLLTTKHAPSPTTLDPEYTSLVAYARSTPRLILYALLCVATGGLFWIGSTWWPQFFTKVARRKLPTSDGADVVLLCDANGNVEEVAVHRYRDLTWLDYRKQRYIYQNGEFQRVASNLSGSCAGIVSYIDRGLGDDEVDERRQLFGSNIMGITSLPVWLVLVRKVVHPFYLFQFISVGLWLHEDYITYSLAILTMSLSSIAYEVYAQVTNDRQMRALVKMDDPVQVLRNSKYVRIDPQDLVLGDIVLVEQATVSADMLLLVGQCTTDESSLTGEAIPVPKPCVQITHTDVNDTTTHKASLLYCGSSVLRVKAVGYGTSKGELFRLILYPTTVPFKLRSDSYRYLYMLCVFAVVVSAKRIYDAIEARSTLHDLLISVFDLISTAIPAALPMILTVGIGFALRRLQKGLICCTDAQKINISGQLTCFCFDKTGTLTSDSLVFAGVDLASGRGLELPPALPPFVELGIAVCHNLTETNGVVTGYPLELEMLRATSYTFESSAAPSLDRAVSLGTAPNGVFLARFAFDAAVQRSSVVVQTIDAPTESTVFVKGSPEAMAEVCDPKTLPHDYFGIVTAYSRRGYYCMVLASKPYTVAKTAPMRADVESNVTFVGFLLFLNPIKPASTGVIQALEDADIDVRIITGDNALTAIHGMMTNLSLIMVAFPLVAQQLKMQFKPRMALVDLVDDCIQYQVVPSEKDKEQVMITIFPEAPAVNDTCLEWQTFPVDANVLANLLRVHDLTLTGAALEHLRLHARPVAAIIDSTKIFARIRPQLKTWIVTSLMASGHYVGMCGDGTNDCGALKAAHVGLALSDAEASIGKQLLSNVRGLLIGEAVAPFTSRRKDVADVVTLVREGRCALMTSFLSFKYMLFYPIIETCVISVINSWQASLSNNQYLCDDFFIVLVLSLLMLQSGPAPVLSKARPPNSLFARVVVLSIVGHLVMFGAFLALPFVLAQSESWFCSIEDIASGRKACYPHVPDESGDMTVHAYEVSIAFVLGHWFYITLAVAFNWNDTFRANIFRNWPFVLYTLLCLGAAMSLVVLPEHNELGHFLDLTTPLPDAYCYELFWILVGYFFCAVGYERLVHWWCRE